MAIKSINFTRSGGFIGIEFSTTVTSRDQTEEISKRLAALDKAKSHNAAFDRDGFLYTFEVISDEESALPIIYNLTHAQLDTHMRMIVRNLLDAAKKG
jgi:hypothetical protein